MLTDEQAATLARIEPALESGGFAPFLIHGVTGSGKTEVYLSAIERVVARGREAIVLVPEISLTPQTIRRFRRRFGRVAVLHSHLSDAERHRHWQSIAAGEVEVVVGVRSAVFAPARRLGLIVIDEEHESTFKQETTPRYHARDVAVKRAQMEGIPILLGSATPSLESWRNADRGRYTRLAMPSRVGGRPMPEVQIIDLRHEKTPLGGLSESLRQAMARALQEGGQVILLLNRRGFHTFVICPRCGGVVKCHACDVAATYHKSRHVLICHTCDAERACPPACPSCRATGLHYGGIGTERLEREIELAFPEYASRRMDSDTMRSPGSHEQVLAAFKAGEVRILLGTQMIAKGLDFPNVTLVGVVNADTALHLPDFRAAERTFQLVAQVAGRTGRGDRPGRVLVQTYCAGSPGDPGGGPARLSRVRRQRAARAGEIRRAAVRAADPHHRPRAGGIGRLRLSQGDGRGPPPGGRAVGPHPRARPGPHPQDPQPLPLPHPAPMPRAPAPPGPGAHRAADDPRTAGHRAGHRRRPDPHAVRPAPTRERGLSPRHDRPVGRRVAEIEEFSKKSQGIPKVEFTRSRHRGIFRRVRSRPGFGNDGTHGRVPTRSGRDQPVATRSVTPRGVEQAKRSRGKDSRLSGGDRVSDAERR